MINHSQCRERKNFRGTPGVEFMLDLGCHAKVWIALHDHPFHIITSYVVLRAISTLRGSFITAYVSLFARFATLPRFCMASPGLNGGIIATGRRHFWTGGR